MDAALAETRRYWKEKVNVTFATGDADGDRLMKWVCFQPYLRRLFGCSFLPHHDYGRGRPGLAGPVAGLPFPAAHGARSGGAG